MTRELGETITKTPTALHTLRMLDSYTYQDISQELVVPVTSIKITFPEAWDIDLPSQWKNDIGGHLWEMCSPGEDPTLELGLEYLSSYW